MSVSFTGIPLTLQKHTLGSIKTWITDPLNVDNLSRLHLFFFRSVNSPNMPHILHTFPLHTFASTRI